MIPMPLPKRLLGEVCAFCESGPSRWVFRSEISEAVATKMRCSNCLLFGTDWGREREAQITELIRNLSLLAGEIPVSPDTGLIEEVKDADAVAFAIVMTDRFLEYDLHSRASEVESYE